MPRRVLICLVALLAAGCSAPAKWAHPNKDEQAFNRDKRECWNVSEHVGEGRQPKSSEVEPDVETPEPSRPGQRQARRQTRFEQCMFERGWHKVTI